MVTTTFQITNLHCISCSLIIEEELADNGVKARVNYTKQIVDVTYDEKKVTVANIQAAIEKLGYEVVN